MSVQRSSSISKVELGIFAFLLAVSPPLLIPLLAWYTIRPAIRHQVPKGGAYVLWVLSLILWPVLPLAPFGKVTDLAKVIDKAPTAQLFLLAYMASLVLVMGLIYATLRTKKFPNSYLPYKKFKLDFGVLALGACSLLPLLLIPLSGLSSWIPHAPKHPMMFAAVMLNKGHSTLGVFLGFLSIGILGPILEEMVFRGLLLEADHDASRSRGTRRITDVAICRHYPQ